MRVAPFPEHSYLSMANLMPASNFTGGETGVCVKAACCVRRNQRREARAQGENSLIQLKDGDSAVTDQLSRSHCAAD